MFLFNSLPWSQTRVGNNLTKKKKEPIKCISVNVLSLALKMDLKENKKEETAYDLPFEIIIQCKNV